MEVDADNLESSSGVIYDPSPANVINPQTATCLYNESGGEIYFADREGQSSECDRGLALMNAILDSGSQKCLCSLEASNFLGLDKYSMNSTIVGLNGACISVRKGISSLKFRTEVHLKENLTLIVPKITGCVPTQPLDLTKIKLPQNIRYADAEFNIPKRIDILLGGLFGYIVTGSIQNEPSNYYFCNFIQDQVDRNLTKFWDLEAIGIKAESSCDPDDQAMQHFKSSVRFNSGRYDWVSWKSHLNDNEQKTC
ncbi:hypothetical protein TNCV_823461 [Trichonephila clavipes]|nr:hypothetical protein TNCV_823461 [Trichonephila clavipes]